MSDSGPDQEPKPQSKWSGGPPRPPKKTARGLDDGSEGDKYPIDKLVGATLETNRLIELLESVRGSRLVALNRLETNLDELVVEFGKIFEQLQTEDQEIAGRHLRIIRDYRRRYPRLETGDRELRERARKILDEIK